MLTIDEVKKLIEPLNYTVVFIDDPDFRLFGDYAWIRRGDPPDWGYVEGTPEEILETIKKMANETNSMP